MTGPPAPAGNDLLLDALIRAVGPAHVVTDPVVLATFGRDWTGRFGVAPSVAVRPADTAETAAVLRACHAYAVAVVPQGGRTGLVGGSVPAAPGAVVVSSSRMTGLSSVDHATRQVTAGAGVTLADLARHAQAAGLAYGVDLAARETATVGGTMATNAGGVRVVRHGDTRTQVAGVEAVLGDGTVLSRLHGWAKDSSGYDLSGLLVGSEGTLGIITAARLRLVAALPEDRSTVLFGASSLAGALEVVDRLRGALPDGGLLAAEFVVGDAMELVCDVGGLPFPLRSRWPVYALVETAAAPAAATVLGSLDDAVVDRRLWAYRERQSEAAHSLGVVHSLDVAVPLNQLDACVAALPAAAVPARVLVFGHLAEGNLHVQLAGLPADDARCDEAVLRLVADLGGSISSEHGIGVAKAQWLHLTRSPSEIAAMGVVKRALDPAGILNPGVILPR